ncbi:MAG: hypothetical protein ACW98X_17545 [Promethearchaeota archaeon]|jgi:hypothetical protein
MGIGKILSLVAGIITLLATFLFSWYAVDGGGGIIYYAGGLGIIKNLPAMFTNAQGLGSTLGIPFFALYIIAAIFILFLASGILQILGIKSRIPLIIGTILSLGIGSLIWLGSADVINRVDWIVNILGTDTPLIEGVLPLSIFGIDIIDLGVYLLYAGGIIGIVAAVYGP